MQITKKSINTTFSENIKSFPDTVTCLSFDLIEESKRKYGKIRKT